MNMKNLMFLLAGMLIMTLIATVSSQKTNNDSYVQIQRSQPSNFEVKNEPQMIKYEHSSVMNYNPFLGNVNYPQAKVYSGARYIESRTDLMRDYQIKLSEDEKTLIVFDGLRKVGILDIPKYPKYGTLSWMIYTDMYSDRDK